MHLWQCPPVSPCTAGVACPVVLYEAKTVPPTRAERRQETTIRRRHCTAGTGPNHRRSRRHHLRRNPRPVTQQRSLFYAPHRQRQLSDWAFPSTNDSNDPHEASVPTYENDDDDTITLNSSLHNSAPIAWIDKVADGVISWKPQPSSPAPRQDATQHRRIVTAQHQVPSSSSSTDQGFIISKILTQNTHGLRRRPKDENGNICLNAPHDYTRYEHLITTMKLKQLDVYFVQKTWLERCDDNLR